MKKHDYPVAKAKRYTSAAEQNQKILDEAYSFVEAANLDFTGTRTVTKGAAKTVVERSLEKTDGQPFSVRKHQALTDISHYIALAQRNRVMTLSAQNTDLLPLAHPRSSKKHNLSLAQLLERQARWYTDDPEIRDESVKTLIASALTAHPASPEHEYAITRLANLPQGSVPKYALVAAFGDGNSSAARRARAMLQRRDRKGRFAEMGGGLRALIRRAAGIFNLNGRVVAEGIGRDTFDMELPDGKLVRIPAQNAEAVKAYIPQKGNRDGYSPSPAKVSAKDPIINEADLEVIDAPDGFREDTAWQPDEGDRDYYGDNVDLGKKYTDDAYDIVKFDKPNAPAKDKFEIAEQREGEGQNVIAVGKGKDGALDPDLPVYFVNRRGGDERPFAAVQSWADAQALMRDDEPRYQKGERPNPNQGGGDEGARIPNKEETIQTPEGEEVEGEVIPKLRKPTRRDIRDFERRMKQFEKGKGLFPLDPRKDHLVADDGRVIDLENGEVLFDPRPRRAKVRLAPDQAPKNFYDFDRKEKYEPEGPVQGQESPDFTDDPAELAQKFEEGELKDALRQSVVGNDENPATGYGPLEFEEGDEVVPAEAIYEALKEKGSDADKILDDIYRAPEDKPAEAEDLEKVAEVPTPEDAVPEMKELPLLEGLNEDERARAEQDPAEFLPKNEDFEVPEGYAELDKEPFNPEDMAIPEEAPEDFNFNPVDIARKYDNEALKNELRRSLEPGNEMPGFGALGQETPEGEPYVARVPGEAIRDALQLQGEDTNRLIDDIYREGREGQGEPDAQEVQDALEGENVEEAEAPVRSRQEEAPEAPQPPAEDEAGPEAPAADGDGDAGAGGQEADLAIGEPHRAMVAARDLQPGDIAVRDDEYFVIEEVGELPDLSAGKQGNKKLNRVNVKGYYPGHKTQDRNWFANGEIEVIRNVAPPEKGDKDPLDKPELADYGKMMKKDGEWGLRDPEAQARYDADMAAHKAAVKAAGADFVDPTKAQAEEAKVNAVADDKPAGGPFVAKFRAEDLQPGDIAFDNHFKVVEVREGEKGKMVIVGHYPGMGLQEKQWKKDTPIEVIRGIPEGEGPELGEGSLHRPAGRGPKGGWFPDDDPAANEAHQKRIEEVKARWNPPANLPVISAADAKGENQLVENEKPPRAPRELGFPAFQGRFAELAMEANGDWKKFRELLNDEEIVVFDFETTGIDPKDGNEPYQIAAYKIRNGEIVDKFVMYMNPGRPLKGTYAEKNAVGPDGGPLPENFFDDKQSQQEVLAQFLEWAGENPLLVAQNIKFDDEVFRRKAEELGLNYAPGGLGDTMGLAAEMFKDDPNNPGRKNLEALAQYAGVKLENWHNAEFDALATAELWNALLKKAEDNNFGNAALDADARQAEYDAKMAELKPKIDEYKQQLADYLARQALRNALEGKEVNLADLEKQAGVGGIPEGPVNEIGRIGAPEQLPEPVADLVDVDADSAFPDGRMRIADPDFVNNPENVDALMRGEIKVENLRPGDFVRPNRDKDDFYQVVAIRGGDEFGVEEFKRRVLVQNKEGDQKVVFWNQNAFLDEVRRPKDRRVLAAGPEDKDALEEAGALEAAKPEMKDGEVKAVPTNLSDVKAKITRDGDNYVAEVNGADDNGNEVKFDGVLPSREAAEEYVKRASAQAHSDMKAARGEEKDKSLAVGNEPANINEIPQVEHVDDLPVGRGENEITPRAEGEEVVYNSKGKVIDDEGEVIAQVEEDFPDRKAASDGGEENIKRAAEALADEIARQREGMLLRTEGRGRRNLPPIPEKYRRQVYIRLLAGLYADADGNPLAIGDKVVHENPKIREKYGEGVVVGKVQGKIGGLQRKGVVYVDYVRVQYPNGEIRKYVSRFQRHVDPAVAKERFDAEPRINWMNQDEMDIALAERRKKPRKGGNAEQDAADDAVEQVVEQVDEAVGQPAAPEPEEAPEAPEAPAAQEQDMFKLIGDEHVRRNGQLVENAKVRDVKVGDYVQTRRGNFGRVIGLNQVGDRVAIKVEYPNGGEYEYRPYRLNGPISGLYRIDGEQAPQGEAPAAPQTPQVEAPEVPQAARPKPEVVAQDAADRNVPVPRIAAPKPVSPDDAAVLKQEQDALKDLKAIKKEIGPQNRARTYAEQRFIKNIQEVDRKIKSGDLRMGKYYLGRAQRRLDQLPQDMQDRYRDRLQNMEVIFRNADNQQSAGPKLNFDGLPLEEFDPIAVRDKRIADGENKAQLNDFWKAEMFGNLKLDELAQQGLDIRQHKDEIRRFFDGEPKPLASLPENARFALQAIVQRNLVKQNKTTEEKNNLRNLVELADALHKERLAFEPNDGNKLDARGAMLLEFSPSQIASAKRGGGRLTRNGQDLGFRVEATGMGGGRRGANKTYRIIDEQTGKVYFYKIDTDKENIDAELAAVDLARALGMHGVYPAEAHPKESNVIVLGQAGQNLKMKKGPKVFAQENVGPRELVDNGPVNQVFQMMVLDAVMHNNDRHGQNFLVAKPQDRGAGYRDIANMPLMIDNGLGQVIATKEENYYGKPVDPVEYIMNPPGRNRAANIHNYVVRALGPKGVYELMQLTTQQAIQELRRMYPAGANPDMDKLVSRLERLKNADISEWGG
jgi:DNA polymerase III epsilon subunit-like protein